jgi:hypothetical protein
MSGIRTSNLVEMTPEETAIRVAAFDRFIEYKRQLWESLTPEEKLESDRQFENLQKQRSVKYNAQIQKD